MSAGKQRNSVARNRYVANKLREMDRKVVEYGKPSPEIFEFAIEKILKETDISKEKIVMIGDTRETDIADAKNLVLILY